jgi:glycosyltransferase involved in cell wall biosynthesis
LLTKPPISVIVCVYNGAQFIEEQLASIIVQTYGVAEIIVVDDASSDDTFEVVKRAAARDNRIALYKNEFNIGFTANFEKAMKMANHDFIAIADQDDIWNLHKIEKMMAAFKPDAAAIYCDSVHFSKKIPAVPVANKKNRRIQGTEVRKLSMYNTVSGHALIIRKSLLAQALPIPSNIYYDWWLALQAATNGGLQFLDEILVYQRVHDNNATISKDISKKELRNNYRNMLGAHLKAFTQIDNLPNVDKEFFVNFENHWSEMLEQGSSSGLFFFMLKHRKNLFHYKKRKLPFFAAVKHSFLFAYRLR